MVHERRLQMYDSRGILYFERDADGVVQESYYPTIAALRIKHPRINSGVLVVDLTKK